MRAPGFVSKQGLLFAGVLALGVGLGWWMKPQPAGAGIEPAATAVRPAETPAAPLVSGAKPATEQTESAPVKDAEQKIVTVAATQEVRDAAERFIDEAALTYDVQAVELIAPYLVNGDATIRRLALDGLIRASDPAGAKALREAATRLVDASEAAAFLVAAEFLELPPMKSRKKRAAKAETATAVTAQ
jgi:hypothetical protein